MLFSVNPEVSSLIDLKSKIIQLMTCATDNELNQAVSQLEQQHRSFVIVSSKEPSTELLSRTHMVRYYYLAVSDEKSAPNFSKLSRITCIDYLADELYHHLGEYYRQKAQHTIAGKQDRIEAKRLLAKSKRCYEILEQETEKKLKHYADILKSQHGGTS
jgi:hypothetical protein